MRNGLMRVGDTPRNFLQNSRFRPRSAQAKFPNARRFLLGGIFVSHAGADTAQIREQIIHPVVFQRFIPNGYFMHSRVSGGAEHYKQLVQAALYWCDKFIVVVSRHAVQNEWVRAEVEWALTHMRPIFVCRLDEFSWSDLITKIDPPNRLRLVETPSGFDFSSDQTVAQKLLAVALDGLLLQCPYRGPQRLK